MDAKAEAKAEADSLRHAQEFRAKRGITDAEWQLAEEHVADLVDRLFEALWATGVKPIDLILRLE
jgi:hypothetical protein